MSLPTPSRYTDCRFHRQAASNFANCAYDMDAANGARLAWLHKLYFALFSLAAAFLVTFTSPPAWASPSCTAIVTGEFKVDMATRRSLLRFLEAAQPDLRTKAKAVYQNYRTYSKLVRHYLILREVLQRHDKDHKPSLLTDEQILYLMRADNKKGLTPGELERDYATEIAKEVRDRNVTMAEELVELMLLKNSTNNQVEPWKKKWLARAFLALNGWPQVLPPHFSDTSLKPIKFFSAEQSAALGQIIQLEAFRKNSAIPKDAGDIPPLEKSAFNFAENYWNLDFEITKKQIALLTDHQLSQSGTAKNDLFEIQRAFRRADSGYQESAKLCCGAKPACGHCVNSRQFVYRSKIRLNLIKHLAEAKVEAQNALSSHEIELDKSQRELLENLIEDKMQTQDWLALKSVSSLKLPSGLLSELQGQPLFDLSSQTLAEIATLNQRASTLDLQNSDGGLLLNELKVWKGRY